MFPKHGAKKANEIRMVAPRGFDQVTSSLEIDFEGVGLAA
jgi:hypothetical protein